MNYRNSISRRVTIEVTQQGRIAATITATTYADDLTGSLDASLPQIDTATGDRARSVIDSLAALSRAHSFRFAAKVTLDE